MNRNQRILSNFFSSIIKVVARNTSEKYAEMVLKKYIESKIPEYSFLKYIKLETLSLENISISTGINNVSKENLSSFIKDFIDNLFPHLFVHLLLKELDEKLIEDLEKMDVQI